MIRIHCRDANGKPLRCRACTEAPKRDPVNMARTLCPNLVPPCRDDALEVLDKAMMDA